MHEVEVCGVGEVRGLVVVGVRTRRPWVARRSLARVRRGGGEVDEERGGLRRLVKRFELKFRWNDWTRVGRSEVWFDILFGGRTL